MWISQEEVADLLPWPNLVNALRRQFKDGCEVPTRHHHTVKVPGEDDATLLLMPAWIPGKYIGTKIANVFPSNTKIQKPSISADYLLFDGKTGERLAVLDGATITARRTAAASALGASFLAVEDARTLFMVGAGKVASMIPFAFRAVRPIEKILVWDMHEEGAERLCNTLNAEGFDASVELDLQQGTTAADIISCATLSTTPLIKGSWLKPGQHLDLIGSFTPTMRETDDDAFQRANVYIDTDAAFSESGDLIMPIDAGNFSRSDVKGTLDQLSKGEILGRTSADDVTLFKAVGTALEDLAAAALAYETASAHRGID